MFRISESFFEEVNLELLNESLGVLITLEEAIGRGHAVGFFKCDNIMKFVDNNSIINYNYKSLFEKINELRTQKQIFYIFNDNERGLYIVHLNRFIYFLPNYEEIDIEGPLKVNNKFCISYISILNKVDIDLRFFEDKLSYYQGYEKTTNFLKKIKIKILPESILKEGNLDIVNTILANEPNLDIKNSFGDTSIMIAIVIDVSSKLFLISKFCSFASIALTISKFPLLIAIINGVRSNLFLI